MKRLNVAWLALILVISSGYVTFFSQSIRPTKIDTTAVATLPIPALKPIIQKTETWPVHQPGHLRRLSLENFESRRNTAPSNEVSSAPPIPQPEFIALPTVTPPSTFTLDVSKLTQAELAAPLTLNDLGEYQHIDLTDRLIDMAKTSPVQPQKRGCAASSKSIKSVGVERQLTDKTSLGVEYIYKEKCHSQNIAILNAHDIPSDKGVKMRLNMRF